MNAAEDLHVLIVVDWTRKYWRLGITTVAEVRFTL
jgi:hypothetical protein